MSGTELTIRERLLRFIEDEGGSVQNAASNNQIFFDWLMRQLGEPMVIPTSIGEEIRKLDLEHKLIVVKRDGPGSSMTSISLAEPTDATEETSSAPGQAGYQSIKARLLQLINEEGPLVNTGPNNTVFFIELSRRLGSPHVLPGSLGTELATMERKGLVVLERRAGPRTPIVSVRLSSPQERAAVTRASNKTKNKTAAPKTAAVVPHTNGNGAAPVQAELIPPRQEIDQAMVDHAEAIYFKGLLLKVAELDMHTFIAAAKEAG